MNTLVRLLKHCERRLDREDLARRDRERPARVSADAFFKAYAWALLVSGIARKSARTWTERTAFWQVFTPRACRRCPIGVLLRRVGVSRRTRMGKKLAAVAALGRELYGLSPTQVAEKFFAGTIRTARLCEEHVPALDALPFVGPPNARFIIRNMGGELIKDDRWLRAIMRYFRCTVEDLRRAGARLGWKAARVDRVLWRYCEQEIRSTNRLPRHFRDADF